MSDRALTCLCAAALVLLAAGCANTSDCFVDSDCGKGKICERERCISGSRDGNDDGDPILDGDGVPVAGDPGLTPTDSIGLPSNLVGPEIVIVEPSEYEIVIGVIRIAALVVDPDGLSETEPVLAIIGDNFVVELTGGLSGLFQGVFDTTLLGIMQFPRLVITAADVFGNRNSVGYEFALDNFGPVVSFRSPEVQYYRYATTSEIECSVETQPLGFFAVQHGDAIVGSAGDPFNGFIFFPRLRIQDRGNGSFGYAAGVDTETTYLYLLDKAGLDAGNKLVVGSGGECVGINPALIPDPANPQPWQAIVQRLVRVERLGVPNFTQDAAAAIRAPCTWNGNSCLPSNECCSSFPCYRAPEILCSYEPVTIWLTDGAGTPLIYVLNDYDAGDCVMCAGGAFDTRNFSADGPVCLAAVAYDRVGNAGVSPPIAICVDRDGSGDCAGFGPGVNAAALCSDGCSAPDYGTAVQLMLWNP